jgi:hypothetical protein
VLTVTKALAPLGAAWLRTAAGSYTPVMVISAAGGVLGAAGLLALRPARSATGASTDSKGDAVSSPRTTSTP